MEILRHFCFVIYCVCTTPIYRIFMMWWLTIDTSVRWAIGTAVKLSPCCVLLRSREWGSWILQEVILSLIAAIDGKPTLYTSVPPMMGPKHSLKNRNLCDMSHAAALCKFIPAWVHLFQLNWALSMQYSTSSSNSNIPGNSCPNSQNTAYHKVFQHKYASTVIRHRSISVHSMTVKCLTLQKYLQLG